MPGSRQRIKETAKREIKNFPKQIFFTPEKLLEKFSTLPLIIEIGMGKGSFINELAKLEPQKTFLGIEIKEERVFSALKKQQINKLTNLFFYCDNFFNSPELLSKLNAEAIWFNFSDPWPKKRHHKRRLVHPNSLEFLHNLLIPKGKLYFKTDSSKLYTETLEYLTESKQFTIIRCETDLHQSDFPIKFKTEFETKFTKQGIPTKLIIAENN